MPKIAKTEREKRADTMRALISSNLTKNRLTKRDLIEQCSFSCATYYSRERNPEEFKVSELYEISGALNIRIETLIGCKPSEESAQGDWRTALSYHLVKNRLTKRGFIKRCGLSISRYYDCEKAPGAFTLRELYKMSDVLNIRIETLIGCIPKEERMESDGKGNYLSEAWRDERRGVSCRGVCG